MGALIRIWIGLVVSAGAGVLALVDLGLAVGGSVVQWAEDWRVLIAG